MFTMAGLEYYGTDKEEAPYVSKADETMTSKFSPNDAGVGHLYQKGDFIAGGATSFVERLSSGDVIKTAWTSPDHAEQCREELAIEGRIYQRLGVHPRLVKMKAWDSEEATLTLEYMPNGTLKNYFSSRNDSISLTQRLQWIAEATEALQLLHSSGIIHCDVGPHNLLLDSDLSLKIIDFSGSSIDKTPSSVCPGVQYRAPDPNWNGSAIPREDEDLFSLGSTIYFIITGHAPFHELEREEVEERYLAGVFPDLTDLPCDTIISLCWRQEAKSAQEVLGLVQMLQERLESQGHGQGT